MRAGKRLERGLSNWRSVRRWESDTREQLRRRYRLWLHGWCIGAMVVAAMWGAAHLQMVAGSTSLALRYLITLGVGYLLFLLVLRWWGGMLVREQTGDPGDLGVDVGGGGGGGAGSSGCAEPVPAAAEMKSGGGGDFGGGGAEGSFDLAPESGSMIGDVAGGALDVASGADEGAVVVIPVMAVFLAGLFALLGFGWLLLLYFGWELLLTVAVEVAFGYVSARTAVRVAREGWLTAAVRLTWKPLLGAVLCAVLLGALIDHFAPQARSLPHALQLIRQP